MSRILIVASKNPGKAGEIRAVLGPLGDWDVRPLPAGTPEAEETGRTFLENARRKASFYGAALGGWTVADDSGLEVDALGGRPGIHSARYGPTDALRNEKLLAELSDIPDTGRTARFVCALAVAHDGQVRWTTEAHVSGRISRAPVGSHGFGYDPVFFLPGMGRTMGELPPEVKNQLSHRGLALARLVQWLSDAG